MIVVALVGAIVWVLTNPESYDEIFTKVENTGAEGELRNINIEGERTALTVLEELDVKGRAPKTGYSREMFYDGWPEIDGCSLRQRILKREMGDSAVLDGCYVVAGEFDEPYTGEHRTLTERSQFADIQIDHVVALSDAWQKGAQNISQEARYALATDPLNLLAVDGGANKQKSDGDAATWLPKNKAFRCQYVARQVAVKYKYKLWVTQAEKDAIVRVLGNCPSEPILSGK